MLYFFVDGYPGGIVELLKKGWGGYALWFIPILLISCLIHRCLFLLKSNYCRLLVVTLLLLLGVVLSVQSVDAPWSLSSVPYSVFLVWTGYMLRCCKDKIEKLNVLNILFLLLISFLISQFFRLDMCINDIMPVIPITIGAVGGTFAVFSLSCLINVKTKKLSRLFCVIGQHTFVVVAYSQIIIMLINQYLTRNFLVKYLLLIFCLVAVVAISIIGRNFYKLHFRNYFYCNKY